MSINEGQIFVRHGDYAAVQRAAETYLRQFFDESYCKLSPDIDEPEEWLLSDDFIRTLILLPPEEGWCAVLDGFRLGADEDMARSLSLALRCEVVWAVIQGSRYAWQYRIFNQGRMARRSHRMWAREGDEAKTPRFRYMDVEAEAYSFLLSCGVPASYALRSPQDFLDAEKKTDGREIEATVYRMDGLSADRPRFHKQGFKAVFLPGNGGIPVRIDLQYRDDDGRRHYEEVRSLTGPVSSQEVDELLAVELELRNRYTSVHLDEPDPDAPVLHFRYSHDEISEEDLRKSIEDRRPEFFANHWTMREFLALSEDLLRKNAKGPVEVVRDGFSLVCRPQGTTRRYHIHLDNLYRDYRKSWGPPHDLIRNFLSRIVELPESRVPSSLNEARPLLFPQLMAAPESSESPDAHDPAVQPFVGNLRVRLILDCGNRLIHVPGEWLKKWSVTFDSLWGLALRNLDAASQRCPEKFTVLPFDSGRILVASFSDGHTASRVLLPSFQAAAAKALGCERLVVGLPGRDSLSAVSADEPFLVEKLHQVVLEAYREESHPLSPEMFAWDAAGLNALHTVGQ